MSRFYDSGRAAGTTRDGLICRLYERVTGRPWLTVRQMSAEFGEPDTARYVEILRRYSDRELIEDGPAILARIREHHAAVERIRVEVGRETVR